MAIQQYPDSIVVSWNTEPEATYVLDDLGEPTDVPTGDYTAGSAVTHTFDCRAEMNTSGRRIVLQGDDGGIVDYAFDIYMPKTDVVIPDFADYILNASQAGKVKRAKNSQLNSRLWL